MKWFKRIGMAILFLPFILILGVIVFEIVGMSVNHAATDRQTKKLQADLTEGISDLEIINVNSETGNSSGTGNHVECMSTIIFSTEMNESEIEEAMAAYYDFDNEYCIIRKEENGTFSIYLATTAPFPDNIEGH
ncbi:MAG: hypothetical protein HDR06_20170 [Lachnospiraceae bacterium]|nr:hypothetical protein [Lachnospiraceae bacterium]